MLGSWILFLPGSNKEAGCPECLTSENFRGKDCLHCYHSYLAQTSGPSWVCSSHLSCTLSIYVYRSSSVTRSFALKNILITHSSMTERMQLQEARQIRAWRLYCIILRKAAQKKAKKNNCNYFLRTTLFNRRPELLECLGCSGKRSEDLQGSDPRSIRNSPLACIVLIPPCSK